MELNEVKAIAHLARLGVTDTELKQYQIELNKIVDLVEKMQAVDTTDIKPLAHPYETVQILRADEITASNQRDLLQSTAPSIENGLFKVPKVIE